MSLFQTSVLKKYLRALDRDAVDDAWTRFHTRFFDPEFQNNVRRSKEEQYQEGFLRDLFVNVLGYTLNPDPGFNLTTELKNIRGAKKTDGAILQEGSAVAVIELKGTDTVSLDKIEDQAFGYKRNQPDCNYVITSNFEKLRFYIEDAIDYEDFHLFQLTKERFELLWLCLSPESIFADLPRKIKSESLTEEENVTKKLYKDYSAFRREVFDSIVIKNPDYDKLILFKSTQKLLDRFLFVFFAEDRGLIPPNSIREIIRQWTDLKEAYDAYIPLYSRFRKYFDYLNLGHKGKAYEIFAYNGGLFAPDELLDSITIDDEVLYKQTQRLSDYDFESEVSVNILGHIFEHSLNEIEEIQADIDGIEVNKSKTRRRRDGVFYTPKYITKYIVDNTVGKLCTEKKEELGIDETEYGKDRKNRPKKKLKELLDKLESYRTWLLGLTICDPACGSGAFLNQTLEYLIAEHTYIDTLNTKLLGGGFNFPNVENAILESNLYGVDINQESVEIAKLSLWLRTAQRGRKLTSLNNNIKTGNSLIDDPAVAGDLTFNWEAEFPHVFEKGGFDVVIGNPPYVRQELVKQYSESLRRYKVYSGKGDLYTYFYEIGYEILRTEGILSYISSGKFVEANYGLPLLDFITNKYRINEIINFDDLEVFHGISAYPLIFIGYKCHNTPDYTFEYCYLPNEISNSIAFSLNSAPRKQINSIDFVQAGYKFFDLDTANLFRKLNYGSTYLSSLNFLPVVGIKTGYNEGFLTDRKSENTKPYIFGRDLKRYMPCSNSSKIIFPYKKEVIEYELINESELGDVIELLKSNKARLEKRAIIKDGILNGTKNWYEYQQINKKINFELEYIVYPNVSLGPNFTLSKGSVIDMTGFIIESSDRFLLGLLNSKITSFIMNQIAITRRGGYHEYKVQYLEKVPIKVPNEDMKQQIVESVEGIISLSIKFEKSIDKFLNFLQSKYPIERFSKKLHSWHELTFGDFLKELKKKKIKLSLREEAEWMPYFDEEKAKALKLRQEIDAIDAEIDQMVYQIYGLTDEEIAIVEEAVG